MARTRIRTGNGGQWGLGRELRWATHHDQHYHFSLLLRHCIPSRVTTSATHVAHQQEENDLVERPLQRRCSQAARATWAFRTHRYRSSGAALCNLSDEHSQSAVGLVHFLVAQCGSSTPFNRAFDGNDAGQAGYRSAGAGPQRDGGGGLCSYEAVPRYD